MCTSTTPRERREAELLGVSRAEAAGRRSRRRARARGCGAVRTYPAVATGHPLLRGAALAALSRLMAIDAEQQCRWPPRGVCKPAFHRRTRGQPGYLGARHASSTSQLLWRRRVHILHRALTERRREFSLLAVRLALRRRRLGVLGSLAIMAGRPWRPL